MASGSPPHAVPTSLLSATGTHLNIRRDVSPTVTHFFSLRDTTLMGRTGPGPPWQQTSPPRHAPVGPEERQFSTRQHSPAPPTVIGRTNRPSRALPSLPRAHWPPPPRPHPLVGRALPRRTPLRGDWLGAGGGTLPPASPPSPSADALDGCHHLLDVILGTAAGLGPHRAPRHGARSPAAPASPHPPPHPAPRTRLAWPARALRVLRHHARHAPAAAPAQTHTPPQRVRKRRTGKATVRRHLPWGQIRLHATVRSP